MDIFKQISNLFVGKIKKKIIFMHGKKITTSQKFFFYEVYILEVFFYDVIQHIRNVKFIQICERILHIIIHVFIKI